MAAQDGYCFLIENHTRGVNGQPIYFGFGRISPKGDGGGVGCVGGFWIDDPHSALRIFDRDKAKDVTEIIAGGPYAVVEHHFDNAPRRIIRTTWDRLRAVFSRA